jgi:3-hydroxyisobutyrate dehydrogenase-like beta-hydroxyacid dehydrogenase
VSFSAPIFKIYGQIMADGAYDQVGFTAELALKDANLVLAAADAARVPLPGANVVRDRLLSVIAHGDGGKDWAVMAREQARACGLD